jgi:hypothetical protein
MGPGLIQLNYLIFKVQDSERLDHLDLMLEPGLSACWIAG